MLGIIGFMAAAVVVAGFVVSFIKSFPKLDFRTARSFSAAFSILSLVMVLCAGTFLVNPQDVGPVILAVDVLMLIATGFMLDVLFRLNHPIVIAMLSFVMACIVAARAYFYLPTAFVEHDLLHFNLEGEVRVMLLGIILLIWLPASITAVTKALRTAKLSSFIMPFILAYIMLVLVTATFFSARQEIAIIATFATLIFIFAVITLANLLAHRYAVGVLKRSLHGK